MSFTVECAAATSARKHELKAAPESRGVWSPKEHQLFVEGIRMYPSGPWKDIANHVGTRTARQTMTHAQKYRQKIARRLRNVQISGELSLPCLLDQSSRFTALLSSDEQYNDSILATSLAIAAEGELEMLGESGKDCTTLQMQKLLPLAIDFSSPESNPCYLDGPSFEPSDIEFDKCMDFLIETYPY